VLRALISVLVLLDLSADRRLISVLVLLDLSADKGLISVQVSLDLSADKGFISVLVLLDLSAVFDTIDHDILLQRLNQSIGISGTALSWFKSYSSDRSQFVFVNDEASITTNISHGIPQGSVFGPILFTLYMLPLGNIINYQYNEQSRDEKSPIRRERRGERCSVYPKTSPAVYKPSLDQVNLIQPKL